MTAVLLPKKLKKEPLVDAVFEVRFSSSIPASSVLPGLFFAQLEGAEKQIERLLTADIPSQLRSVDPVLRFQPLLRLHSGDFLILVGDASLGIACKMPYPGWNAFKTQIIKVVGLLKDTQIVQTVDRYALKYVNVVDGKDLVEQIHRINMDLRLGKHTLKSESFTVRVEVPRDDFIHVVQVAAPVTVQMIGGEIRIGVIVDTDTICNYQTNDWTKFMEELPDRLESVHTDNKEMFFECLQPETVNYLEPIYE